MSIKAATSLPKTDFSSDAEQAIKDAFLRDGYYQFTIENRESLDLLRDWIYESSQDLMQQEFPDPETFFNTTQDYIAVDALNSFRVKLIAHIGKEINFRPLLYQLGKPALDLIIGNEIAMQRSTNLSIQLPNDDSSLLPLHSDVWSGHSPYEVVFWLPLTDCYKTRSMYVLPRHKSDKVLSNFKSYSSLNAEEFYEAVEKDLIWLDVPYGEGIIFSHSIIHGNRINREKKTRWSTNTRFKSLLSPYGNKEVGESFLPTTMKPATRIGYEYRKPTIS